MINKRYDDGGKYRVKVIADNSGKYVGNGVTFDTLDEAVGYGFDLAGRWLLVRSWAVFTVADDQMVGKPFEVQS